MTSFEHAIIKPKVIVAFMATCILLVILAIPVGWIAVDARAKSNRALTAEVQLAKAQAQQAQVDEQRQRDAFCGLVSAASGAAQSPTASDFGKKLYVGSQKANSVLGCPPQP
jgi:hypothetical protein